MQRRRKNPPPYFVSRPFQRGSGLVSSIMRFALPAVKAGMKILKPTVKKLGRAAARGGKRAAVGLVKDLARGSSVKQSAKRATQQLVKDIIADSGKQINKQRPSKPASRKKNRQTTRTS